jgi:hypothetical protein
MRVPSWFTRTGRVVSALSVRRGSGAGRPQREAVTMKTKHSRDGHSRLIPAMAGKGRCADRRAGTLGSRQTHEFSCSVARGPQPPRGGRRCQEPFDATLATLADALEAIGVNGCRPGRAADGRRRLSSFRKRVSYSAMIGRNPLAPRRCYGRSNSAMRGLVTGPSRAYGVRGSCALNSASTS